MRKVRSTCTGMYIFIKQGGQGWGIYAPPPPFLTLLAIYNMNMLVIQEMAFYAAKKFKIHKESIPRITPPPPPPKSVLSLVKKRTCLQ